MDATCSCQHCNYRIQFDIQHAGSSVGCPHCGTDTTLFVPPHKPEEKIVDRSMPDDVSLLETRLDSAAQIIFILGLVGGFICGVIGLLGIADSLPGAHQPDVILIAMAPVGVGWWLQAWILSLILKSFAEMIRLLRKRAVSN